ncbi:MAG: hypothetical protein CMO55_20915 [Verrucomicrobiales bacterium]|nr:hypothetical protein [Verrucomicrobiales bacterium]
MLRKAPRFIDPIFHWNHDYGMIKGEESLQREVYRRRKERGDWIGDLPVQPGPVFPHNSEKVVAAIPWGSLEDGWEDQPSVSGIRRPV